MGNVTEFIAIVVGLVIAVGGWFATGVQNRRAVRRTTRIEYLLSAYRRLDDASGRALDSAREADLESAVADIQLLGSVHQVELANEFVREFASDRAAGAGPLLESLRQSLRRELLLDRAPPREVWLRIARDGDLWAREVSVVQARLREAIPVDVVTSVDADSEAGSRIEDSFGRLAKMLRSTVPRGRDIGTDEQLIDEAVRVGIIGDATAEAIRGVTVLRNMARVSLARGMGPGSRHEVGTGLGCWSVAAQ